MTWVHKHVLLSGVTWRVMACLAMAMACLVPRTAAAWGTKGHRIVALIAEPSLTKKARLEIAKLLEPDTKLADVANYADAYRTKCANTANWHFVDIPLNVTTYVETRDCTGEHAGCVLSTLTRELAILADRTQSAEDRELALKFVVHFVGDLHQPLHSTDNNDRGGNKVEVHINGSTTNLHKLWDSGLIDTRNLDEDIYVSTLRGSASRAEKAAMQGGTLVDWALEAHRAGHDFAYGKLGQQSRPDKAVELGSAYVDGVVEAMDLQLLRGGLRLAKLLNEAFAKPGPKVDAAMVTAHRACTPGV